MAEATLRGAAPMLRPNLFSLRPHRGPVDTMDIPPPLPRPVWRRRSTQPDDPFRERPWLWRVKQVGSVLLLAGAAACMASMPAAQPQDPILVTQIPYLLGVVACLAAATVIMAVD